MTSAHKAATLYMKMDTAVSSKSDGESQRGRTAASNSATEICVSRGTHRLRKEQGISETQPRGGVAGWKTRQHRRAHPSAQDASDTTVTARRGIDNSTIVQG